MSGELILNTSERKITGTLWRVGLSMLLVFTSIAFGLIAFYYSTLEDALITFRYAERWSEGYDFGMWNRTGAPVEGFTTLLWMILLSAFGPQAASIVTASKFLGYSSYLALIALFLTLGFSKHNVADSAHLKITGTPEQFSRACLATAMALALCMPLSWYALTGMETATFTLLISFSVFLPLLTRNVIPLVVVAVALVLIRPEGVLVSVAAAGYWYVATRDRRLFIVGVVALLTAVALTAFRWQYFGYLLPNTYYAKSGTAGARHLLAGITYYRDAYLFFWMLSVPFLLLLGVALVRRQKLPSLFWAMLLSQIAFMILIARSGGDSIYAFPLYRHFIVLLPLFCCATFLLVEKLPVGQGIMTISILVTLLFAPIFQSKLLRSEVRALPSHFKEGQVFRHSYERPAELIQWLATKTSQETVVATSLAGHIPFYVDANHIDILGLNDELIAHDGTFDPFGPIDSKTDMSLVLDRSPDIIEGYMKADHLLGGNAARVIFGARSKMNIELLNDHRFRNEYKIITNAPYDSFNRILFVRSAWLEANEIGVDIETEPLDRILKVFDESDHRRKRAVLGAKN